MVPSNMCSLGFQEKHPMVWKQENQMLHSSSWWLTFWHRSFTFNSNKSPTWCNNFSVYYSDFCLQLNTFRAFSRPSSGAQWLQWQPLVLPSYHGDSRAVFVVGPAMMHRLTNLKFLSTFRDNLSVPSSRVKKSKNSFVRVCLYLQLTATTWRILVEDYALRSSVLWDVR